MDVSIQVAIIGSVVTLFAALLTTLVAFFHERSEKEKWSRTLELEERRLKHEELKWALELNNQRELELHRMRLRTYPEVFGALGRLSTHNVHKVDAAAAEELSDMFNQWGYGEAGICMLPDTRDALFALRDTLIAYATYKSKLSELTAGIRVDLIELMRRDVNHNWSQWREFKPLIDINREKIQKLMSSQEMSKK